MLILNKHEVRELENYVIGMMEYTRDHLRLLRQVKQDADQGRYMWTDADHVDTDIKELEDDMARYERYLARIQHRRK